MFDICAIEPNDLVDYVDTRGVTVDVKFGEDSVDYVVNVVGPPIFCDNPLYGYFKGSPTGMGGGCMFGHDCTNR